MHGADQVTIRPNAIRLAFSLKPIKWILFNKAIGKAVISAAAVSLVLPDEGAKICESGKLSALSELASE